MGDTTLPDTEYALGYGAASASTQGAFAVAIGNNAGNLGLNNLPGIV